MKKVMLFVGLMFMAFFINVDYTKALNYQLAVEKERFFYEDIIQNNLLILDAEENDFESEVGEIAPGESDVGDCEGLLSQDFIDVLNECFDWIKFLALALAGLFGLLDFGKAIASDDQDGLKKAAKKFKTRLIIVVIIFITPAIINPVLDVFVGSDYDTCGVE